MKVLCEYLTNPVGIDLPKPRFSWSLSHDEASGRQTSYRIVVHKLSTASANSEAAGPADSPADFTSTDDRSSAGDRSLVDDISSADNPSLDNYPDKVSDTDKANDIGGGVVWDTGFVKSDRANGVEYAGLPLETAAEYRYTVTVTDLEHNSVTSEPQFFITGIMEDDTWAAAWLGGPWMEKHAFWFRSQFNTAKAVHSAYAFVVSPNYYVLTINGKRCSDAVLQNATTDSRKTNLYATYRIDQNLQDGANAIGIEIGNGWHALNLGVTNGGVGEHLFSAQIFIRYADGSGEWIYSQPEDWQYTLHGPIGLNSIYQGEFYDAGKEIAGWDLPGFDPDRSGVEWFDAVEFEPEPGVIRAQYLEPIRVVSTIGPVQVYDVGDGSYTFDMGQNFAGWARLSVEGPKGTQISLKYAELMHQNKTVNQISLRGIRATDDYILRGAGLEVYEPRFTFHGFRYVQVFGLPRSPAKDTIIGCVVRSDVEQTGTFASDNQLLNQLQSNIFWTEQSNLHSVPTDCPQRDERLGWTNDMTVRNECALYNFRLAALYTKWLNDIIDTQGSVTGAITDTAPFRVFGSRPADPVGASILLIPWNMYRHYGDVNIIKNCYEANKKFLGYLKRNSRNYIMKWATMGDWAAPIGDNDANSIGGGAVSKVTPPRLIATAFFYYDCLLMAKMADVIGNSQDAVYYLNESRLIRDAFVREYYDPEKKYVYSNSQGCNTIALYLDLVPAADRRQVFGHLIRDITEKHQMHTTTGNICTRYVIELLLTNGYEDIAYELLTQTTYPSWGYMIENGATTIWERWEKVEEECSLSKMASHNHPMYGAVGVSFYKYLAGIDPDELQPGFRKILIRPVIPARLNYVKAAVDTVSGEVVSEWDKSGGSLRMRAVVPFNCTCEYQVPAEGLPEQQINISLNGQSVVVDGEVVVASELCRWQNDHYLLVLPAGDHRIVRG